MGAVERFLCNGLAGMLLLAALGKLLLLVLGDPVLRLQEPVTGLSNRLVLPAVSLIEAVTAFLLLRSHSPLLRAYVLSVLFTGLAAYRVSLWLAVAQPRGCPCFGPLAHWLGVPPEVVDAVVATVLLVGLFLGYSCLVQYARRHASLRMRCGDSLEASGASPSGGRIAGWVLMLAVSGLSATAETWRFSGEIVRLTYFEPDRPGRTNRHHFDGLKDETRFVFSFQPEETSFALEAHCGWDGEMLYTYQVAKSEHASWGPENMLPSNRVIRAYLDSVPVPRFGPRYAQSLALALTPLSALEACQRDGTNHLLTETDFHIPESHARLSFAPFPGAECAAEILARAPNFLWDTRGPAKKPFVTPPPFTNGFPHWRFKVTEVDPRNRFPTAFEFELFFYNADVADDPTAPLVELTGRHLGRIEYSGPAEPPPRWAPVLPRDQVKVMDIRWSRAVEDHPNVKGIVGLTWQTKSRYWDIDFPELESRRAQVWASVQAGAFREPNRARATLVAGLIFALLGPLLLLRLAGRKRNHEKPLKPLKEP